ncbi:MAG: SLBB domain-containing protein [Mucilaginibacter sp.]|uniref:SLBB domain-containing protein n=1 Tax=Mucilaginibacter sp. TaxID=1882438 RepID=UPI003266C041
MSIKIANAQTTSTGSTSTTTTPLTTVPTKSDDVSDAQLRDMVQKAKASGMSDEQIRQAAIAKGMPESEANKLQNRISIIRTAKDVNMADDEAKRKINGEDISDDTEKDKKGSGGGVNQPRGPIVFGSELFNNSNLTFEPSLRIATPQNYVVGPDDQIVIDVYGNSLANWKLNVSPDGKIQIPTVGVVNIGGKTIEQATGMIKSKLKAANYAIDHGTNVSVSLGNIRSIKVYMVGEIVKPGTITLSSLSTVFNALYLSGGPNRNGSLREIEVIRDNSVIRKLDVYDFKLTGSKKDDIRLQDGDIVRVPTYKVQVSLTGQVKTPAIFEVLPGETLKDVIGFAGGFTESAYTSTIKVVQLTDQEKKVVDIKSADFGNYIPLRGDNYTVDRILDSYQNRVSIYGAVTRPGIFELEKGLMLSQLIAKAAGLKRDAFASRGFISRLRSDNTTELVSFDVRGIVKSTVPDIILKKEDVVTIPSIFDLRDQYTVSINGEVRQGGQFAYADNMSVEDLVVQAGGFTQSASPNRIEVARRINNADPNQKNSPTANISIIDIDPDFKVNKKPFILQPFDVVSIYSSPGYEKQRTVRVEGEVLYPGPYIIRNKDEKISDLVKRAGGVTIFADVESGTLNRPNTLGINAEKEKIDPAALQQEKVARAQHIKRTLKDSTTNVDEQFRNSLVGIDLKKILEKPGSRFDLILEEGDVLRIPKEQQLVRVNGEVLFPNAVVYTKSKSLNDFVDNAGGFSPEALKKRAYVVYANGSVKSTHNFLFIHSYPEVKAGSEIIIPRKPTKKGVSLAEFGTVTGALASIAAVLIGIISITRR